MAFNPSLEGPFPGSLPLGEYLDRPARVLRRFGFEPDRSIACVGVCRDEITWPFVDGVQRTWGEAFNFSSLAGMLFVGRTGFDAAVHHAPTRGGTRRHVFFATAHIGIGRDGEPGVCYRAGQDGPSGACGALLGFLAELKQGTVRLDLDPDDLEQSLLRQRLFRSLRYGDVPDLPRLTRIAHSAILEDLERGISLSVDPLKSAWAVLTGIQIHGPDGQEWIWPADSHAWVRGVREDIRIA